MAEVYVKKKIPKAIREQLWIQKIGKKFESKCKTTWCRNKMNVFDFQAGHDIPECKGGSSELANLLPICSRCNLSMGSQHTFKEWCKKGKEDPKWIQVLKGISGLWKSSDTKQSGTKSTPKPTSPKSKPRK
jgi:5-methylcytosine-specific restriction endonuclease McrA